MNDSMADILARALATLRPLPFFFTRNTQAFIRAAVLGFIIVAFVRGAQAGELPVAAGSPIAGIAFDDQPLLLPVQRNFQMAMLTASGELGRSCGRMEAYGWRVDGDEQLRVNQIFNNTIDRIRAQGFVVEAKKTNAVSRDVTLFTADAQGKNLIFLWSAGDMGLVMVLCETSAPLVQTPLSSGAQPASLPAPFEVERERRAALETTERLAAPVERRAQQLTRTGKPKDATFSPVGNWTGSYTCSQGTTGATLTIASLKGNRFEGVMRFYPTAKNPYVPSGSYAVFGEYDADSLRVLVNPGAWIERPKGYYSTIMIGSFDPVEESFSAFFQGITGCTSYEARLDRDENGAQTPPDTSKKEKVKGTKKREPEKERPAVVKKKASVKKTSSSVVPLVNPLDSSAQEPRASVGIALDEELKPFAP